MVKGRPHRYRTATGGKRCIEKGTSKTLDATSQGSFLGPMMYVLYVNDMPAAVHSTLIIFTDDVKVFRKIEETSDRIQLQKNLELRIK